MRDILSIMSSMNSFRDLIDRWPTIQDFAEDTGENIHAVRKWRSRNRIPADRWAGILAAAKKRHIKIDARQLVDFSSSSGKAA